MRSGTVIGYVSGLAFAGANMVINEDALSMVFARIADKINATAGPSARSFMSNLLAGQIGLGQYGCWCPKMNGQFSFLGQPLDEIDMLCRDWHVCRKCQDVAMNDPDNANRCEGTPESDYTPIIGFTAQLSLEYQCIGMNGCTTEVCTCDLEYAFRIVDKINELNLAGVGMNPDNINVGEEACHHNNNFKGRPDKCCGNVPEWKLYISDRQSCVNGELV